MSKLLVAIIGIMALTSLKPACAQSNTVIPQVSALSIAETNGTVTPPQQAGISTKPASTVDALSFAERQVALETARLDKLVQNTERVGGLMATLVVVFASILSYFGYRSAKELKDDMHASVENIVDRTLKDKSKSADAIETLLEHLRVAEDRWKHIEKSIDSLEKFEALSKSTAQAVDARGAYGAAKQLAEKDDVSPDERRVALNYLLAIIEQGEKGHIDPNLLYNASSVASEMDFDHEALKLATLCAHWAPKSSYILRKNRLEDMFGLRFVLTDHKLVLSDQPPAEVRKDAWQVAKELVQKRPTFQCELFFSELHNLAVRNRESGYVDEAVAVMEEVTKDNTVPSYAFVVLSGFYAMRGNTTWLKDYLGAATRATTLLATESPASTWYDSSIEDLLEMAERTNRLPDVRKLLEAAGILETNKRLGATDTPPSGSSELH